MAVIKAISSKAPISTVIDYVSKDEKTEDKLLSGYNLTSPDTAKTEMQATKELWGKTGGRTYKHFVQSFAPDENITTEQAHDLAVKFAEQCKLFEGFEVLIATHQDREHIHTHFVLNSVSFEDGHKFQMKSTDLQAMKDLSDELCRQHSLTVTQKGKTFDGSDREETTAYRKEQYQLLQKAEQGKADSYIQNIALSVLTCREQAVSREDFVRLMKEKGYETQWSDNRKYITFTDISRAEHGEKKCKVRNNKLEQYYHMDFSKEGLEREFEKNLRKAETTRAAYNTINRCSQSLTDIETRRRNSESILNDSRKGLDNSRATLKNSRVRTTSAATDRAERNAERERLEAEEIARIERERREYEERQREKAERAKRNKEQTR